MRSQHLTQPVFGFYLGDQEDGQLVLGGVDAQHYEGDFHFLKVVSEAYWQVQLEQIKVNRAATSLRGAQRWNSAVNACARGPAGSVETCCCSASASEARRICIDLRGLGDFHAGGAQTRGGRSMERLVLVRFGPLPP